MPDAVSRFASFAGDYDAARPTPPADLIRLILQWSGASAPDVVDVGAGSGLSTMIWAGRARSVVAVEPAAQMRQIIEQKIARSRPAARRSAAGRPDLPGAGLASPAAGGAAGGAADGVATRFAVVAGTAEETGLADGCADIVTASQAMHWFDAGRAVPELARILRPGGVLAAYDCDWPPCTDWQADAAYVAFTEQVDAIEAERGLRPPRADKQRHRGTLASSGLFRYVTEVAVHGREPGDGQRLVDVALSQGSTRSLLAAGLTPDEIGLTALREVAARRLPGPGTWWWTYHVRLAVK
ncbi:MAG: class I SAM-dependent methyltransferase [Streptosporangiaceae bacterium]